MHSHRTARSWWADAFEDILLQRKHDRTREKKGSDTSAAGTVSLTSRFGSSDAEGWSRVAWPFPLSSSLSTSSYFICRATAPNSIVARLYPVEQLLTAAGTK